LCWGSNSLGSQIGGDARMSVGYDLIAENPQSTVVAEYVSESIRETDYQSEYDLERKFIELLKSQAYEYIHIKSEDELILNLRRQLSKLNEYEFTDNEWTTFFNTIISNSNESIVEKTRSIQEDHVKLLYRDNGEVKNIRLIDKTDIHNNILQVINQYEAKGGLRLNRYDVTILINGLPLVHIELKRRGVDLQEAFNQINRYQCESFWSECGLFNYVQIFVISNGTYTKYYSNTTRDRHVQESGKRTRTSNSFEFTSWWADAANRPIMDLVDFTKTFFAKHTILNILTKYCVFTVDNMLLVMRPYQIVATERILNRIGVANAYKTYGTIQGGGYIWHTTGSGKTLTSFKTAQLASKLPYIDKVIFVVDRKDLDYQTMREYDKFQQGAANSNSSTKMLAKQLVDDHSKIIITTIQKLTRFASSDKSNPAFQKRLVIIFDECHRSQFGEMHTIITKNFKNYNIFGFTGTPIFAANASSSSTPNLKTTEQAFGTKLHTYTIVDAITDRNVLPFRIDYVRTMKEKENIEDSDVWDIDREEALKDPRRITNIVQYIRDHFDQKTKRSTNYATADRRKHGFNAIFATASIDTAKLYYTEFQKQLKDTPPDKQLKVATIFSYGANENIDGLDDECLDDTDGLPQSSRDFLDKAIIDYNKMFGTNFDTKSEGFQGYYADVSCRVKNRELDLLIVVNMFLTGFDATTLNTLWVDKNLRLHGLLQAFSRTNRILNAVKTFGNIICFRNLEKATNESIALFGDKNARGIVMLKTYQEYYNGYKDGEKYIQGYVELVAQLTTKFPIGEQIVGEQNKKDFIRLYSTILKIRNILSTFDEFAGNEILTDRDIQDYHSEYIDLYNEFRKTGEKENINDNIVFEMELIKQVEINIDYIIDLIVQYHKSHLQDKEIIVSITKAIDSSVELRKKRDLILRFIDSLNPSADVNNDWRQFVKREKEKELEQIIKDEKLNKEATEQFIAESFNEGYIKEIGNVIVENLMPPTHPFMPQTSVRKQTVIDKLKSFLDRFLGI
jgi:type I restriction enzyme R subunit